MENNLSFKDVLKKEELTKEERALAFALYMFAENSIVPGTNISQVGEKTDLVNYGFPSSVLTRFNFIVKIEDVIVLKNFASYGINKLNYSGLEVYRKKQGLQKKKFIDFVEKLVIAQNFSNEDILSKYVTEEESEKTKITISTLIEEDTFGLSKEVIRKYFMQFSTESDFENNQLTKAKRAVRAYNEIKKMFETLKFNFDKVTYEIPDVFVIKDTFEEVIRRTYLMDMKNNNYFKKVLISAIRRFKKGNNESHMGNTDNNKSEAKIDFRKVEGY